MFSGYRRALAALLLVSWFGSAGANTFRVTLTEGPDQPEANEYTFAGALAAANASESPAEIVLDIRGVWVHDGGLEVVHPVTIRNDEQRSSVAIATTIEDGAVLRFLPGASGSSLSGVWFSNELPYLEERQGEAVALSLCATGLVFEDVDVYSYYRAVEIDCPDAVDMLFSSGILSRNQRDVVGELAPASALTFDGTTFRYDVGGFDLQANECGAQVTLNASRFRHVGEEEGESAAQWAARQIYDSPMIRIEGCIDTEVRDSIIQGRSPLLAVAPLDGAEGLAKVVVTNSVIHRTEPLDETPLISFDGDSFTMLHSSIWLNSLASSVACLELKSGRMLLDHSVIAENGCYPNVLGKGGSLDIQYSLLGSLVNDGADQNMDETSAMLLGQNPLIDEVMSVPLWSSPVINAGDPARIPGIEGTPETDLRGSARRTGEALDLGPIEFNNPPVFDTAAFYRDLRDRANLAEAGETIVMYLLDYLSDPDGHDIVDVEMLWVGPAIGVVVPIGGAVYPAFDAATASISGTEDDYRGAEALFAFRDELGLQGYAQPVFDNAWGNDRRGGSSSSGGMMASFFWLLMPLFFLSRLYHRLAWIATIWGRRFSGIRGG